jgi:hypothetical protein
MNIRTLLVAATVIVTGIASAQESIEYNCNYGDVERRITVVHEPGVRVPCEVHYYRDMTLPDDYDVMWTAVHEVGYCEARAEELSARLVEAGWQCDAGKRPARAPEEKVEENLEDRSDPAVDDAVDDTDMLEPAEPPILDGNEQ